MYVEGLVTELAGRGQGALSLLERKLVTLESSSSSLTVPGGGRVRVCSYGCIGTGVLVWVCPYGCWAAWVRGCLAGQQACR